jgi:murein DD-endopeptidase MepM/ murein hydrolase activator NlpD
MLEYHLVFHLATASPAINEKPIASLYACTSEICEMVEEYENIETVPNFDERVHVEVALESNPTKIIMSPPVRGYRISSRFGMRRHPVLGTKRLHAGIDYATPSGTPIKAVADGVIIFARKNGGYGNLLIIRHANGETTRYAHLERFLAKVGETVSKGRVVALSDNTGLSSGPHLHFEIRKKNGIPIDPISRLRRDAKFVNTDKV